MKSNAIQRAVELGEKRRHIFVATSDGNGLPHLAAAGSISVLPDGQLAVSAWFCPGTLEHMSQNRKISLVVWDLDTDTGYQILGSVTDIKDQSFVNGYAPQIERAVPLPQVERKFTVRAETVLSFGHSPHIDIEE